MTTGFWETVFLTFSSNRDPNDAAIDRTAKALPSLLPLLDLLHAFLLLVVMEMERRDGEKNEGRRNWKRLKEFALRAVVAPIRCRREHSAIAAADAACGSSAPFFIIIFGSLENIRTCAYLEWRPWQPATRIKKIQGLEVVTSNRWSRPDDPADHGPPGKFPALMYPSLVAVDLNF